LAQEKSNHQQHREHNNNIKSKIVMKKIHQIIAVVTLSILVIACNSDKKESNVVSTENNKDAGQALVKDEVSMKDIVKIAAGSADHTTLVAALKQAELVDVLANPGPFTVFAPTNAAFEKLPKGTVDDLMKDEKKSDLQNILQYHVTTSSLKTDFFQDGQTLGMVNGDNITINVKDSKITLNNSATVIASIQASNGMVHIIDAVLLPSQK
jgi:uncharacterized surface protein with fasciclin (FAS1) repeats